MPFSHVHEYKGRVLIVDDQQINLDAARLLLEGQGYEVKCVNNGEDALTSYEEFRPDLILLDMMMPGMDGFDVMEELTERHKDRLAPVLFVTAAHDEIILERAFAAGVVDFVTRPYVGRELIARVNAHLGLKLASDRLRRTARDREELVNLVAHDLKNPLSSVLFAAQMLREDGLGADRYPRYFEIIHDAASDAVGYIRDYLESRNPDGKPDHNPDATSDLREVIHWAGRRYLENLQEHGIALSLQEPPEPAMGRIEERVVRQVVENLITNVIKYAPNAPLVLSVRRGAPDYWRIVVTDKGPGLTDDQQRRLFKPFTRFHKEEADEQTELLSSGLGLSLAKRTIESHGGQLWYEAANGGGSSFVIEVPEANGASVPA